MKLNLLKGAYGKGSLYLIVSLLFNKSLEIGYQWSPNDGGIDVHCGFRTRGDHAGLRFSFQFFTFFFEFNLNDNRHWNWNTNRFYTDDEERAEGLLAGAGFRSRLVELEDEE